MYIVTMSKPEAEAAYLNKIFTYALSPAHVLRVKVVKVSLYGGVVLVKVKVLKGTVAAKCDKTNYKALERDTILAGRLQAA